MSIENPNSEQNAPLEDGHSTTEISPLKTATEVPDIPISGARGRHHSKGTKRSKASLTSRVIGVIEIIGGTILVSGLLWIGVVLLWYTSSGLIKFLGILATSIISLFGLLGILWSLFLRNVWTFLSDRHWKRRQFFNKTVLITNVVALLLCGGTLLWGFDPYTHLGWPALSSSMSDSSDSYWHDQVDILTSGKCNFDKDGTYHVITTPQYFHYCVATATDFTDFIYEVQMRFIGDGDCGGLVFRADRGSNSLYVFEICQNQTYCLFRYVTPSSPQIPHDLIGCNESGNLPRILGAISTRTTWIRLAIEVRGEQFVLRVNSQKLDIGFDLSAQELKQGEIGVVADAHSQVTQVAFRNAKVWVFNGG